MWVMSEDFCRGITKGSSLYSSHKAMKRLVNSHPTFFLSHTLSRIVKRPAHPHPHPPTPTHTHTHTLTHAAKSLTLHK